MSDFTDAYERFQARYDEARVPWDDPDPPPEIIDLAAELPPGRVLDIGCGFGRAVIYLAQHGWTAVGIDFVPKAIEEARRRAELSCVADRVEFHVASATVLSFLEPSFDLVIDVGCMHSFTEEMLRDYRVHLLRLLSPGGLFLLFAHLCDDAAPEGDAGPRGIPEAAIHELIGHDLRLERLERGVTQVEDRPPWNSGWFWFRK